MISLFNFMELFCTSFISWSNIASFSSKGRTIGICSTKFFPILYPFFNELANCLIKKLDMFELNTAKIRALRELGYAEIDKSNASEVLDKIAEIMAQKF